MEHTTHFDGCGCPLRSGMAVAVWMTEDFAENYGARSADGRFRFTMALGNPDARGVYNPVITKHDDPLPVFAERDALRLRVAALEIGVYGVIDTAREMDFRGDWIHQRSTIASKALAGDTTALRALLVEAAKQAQLFECEECGATDAPLWRGSHPQHAPGCDGNCGSSCPVECGPTKPRDPEDIADRILGASKEGK